MKKLGIFVLAAIMVMGLAIGAQAATILDNPGSEPNLRDIIFGWTGLTLSNAQLGSGTLLATLPAGAYTLIDYATYSAYNQTLTVPIDNDLKVTPPANQNQAVNVAFSEGSAFGFTDEVNTGSSTFTLATDGTGPANRLAGLIIPLAQFGAVGYIVAFEDGDASNLTSGVWLGDQDYNDMVGYVVPLPPSVLLMGSGLLGLGLVGWRRRLFGQE